MKMRAAGYWVVATFLAGQALAIEPIPQESGVRGYVNLGATAMRVKNNMVAGLSVVDIGEERSGSIFDGPDSESLVVPGLNGEVNYTWAETRLQVFLGNRLEDFIRFDSTTVLGLRQEAGDLGILEGSVLIASLPTKVWEDPYVEGVDRVETDRFSTGVRIGWDKIMGSEFEVSVSTRKISIDTERSGEFVGLSPAEAALLNREGNCLVGEVLYVYRLGEGHFLVPALRATRFDLDGDAMNNDRLGAQVTYTYSWDRVRLVTNLSVGKADYDEEHPIYKKTREDDLLGLTVSGIWPNWLGHERWTGMTSLLYASQDSNISFYDSDVYGLSLSALYRF